MPEARARRLAGCVSHEDLLESAVIVKDSYPDTARLYLRAVAIQEENRQLESSMALAEAYDQKGLEQGIA